jgi:hypothetical protein
MTRLLRLIRPVHSAAAIGVVLFLWSVARFWHPVYGFTAFLQFDEAHEATAVAAFREHPVFAYPGFAPYDGMQYSQVACHPLLDAGELRPAVDSLSYRARRILLPAVAWLLAAGDPAWIAQVYAALNIACWLLLAAVFWRRLPVAESRGALAWTGLLFSAGVLSSVRLALIDLPALLLVALAVWDAERERGRTATGWLAAAALARETSLLASVALFTCPPKSRAALMRGLLLALLAAVPLVIWLGYVRWRVGSVDSGASNFTWPVVGLLGKWRECLQAMAQPDLRRFAWWTLLSTAGLTCQAAFILIWRRPADPWWRLGAVFTALLLCLGTAVWEGFPGAATRVLLPLNLACNVLAVRTRAPLAWLLACNLTIFSGWYMFRDLPRYPDALVARRGRAAVCVEPSVGWSSHEHNSHHDWLWAESRLRLEVRTWPRSSSVEVRLAMKLQGLTPRTVHALADGREIWSGPVNLQLTTVNLPLVVTGGRMALELTCDDPPVLENSGPDARRLGFALYDPAVTVSQKAPPPR